MLRKLGLGIVVAFVMFAARSATASSGRLVGANVSGTFRQWVLYQAANEAWSMWTSNLSSGGDTVLHVQDRDDLQGGFIGGNDDYLGSLSSHVFVPAVGYARVLRVIVRSYDTTSPGTCDFTASSSLGGLVTDTAVPFGGSRYYIGNLAWGAHVMTAERQDGATDTVVLVVGGPNAESWHAVGWDDDDGVGFMSYLHDNETCVGCSVVLANYSSTGTTTADVYWDDDAHGTDSDADGLGASLEQVIGTSDSNGDTDQDGLRDAYEVLGVEVSTVPVKLAAWGADPLQKDMFVEMDWQKCVNLADPTKCPNGDVNDGQMGAGLSDPDFQSAIVNPIKADFGSPSNVRVHFDFGRPNANPSTWNDWGDWGGATMLQVGSDCGEAGNTPERAFMFHHGISYAPEGAWGNSCLVPGPFFNTRVNQQRIITHETGHNLGLLHGGRPHKIAINFKPHYVSLMNYMYQWDETFSAGTAPVQGLNPTSLEERIGLGSGWPDTNMRTRVLTKVRDTWCPVTAYSDGKCVNINGNAGAGIPIGAVDWNRDGTYAASGTYVQGPANTLDFMWKAKSRFAPGTLKDPALTWVSVGGSVGDQLWIFGRDTSNQLVWTRRPGTAINSGCGSFTSFYDEANYDCAGFGYPAGTATTAPGPKVLSFAAGVAEYGSGATKQIVVVFQKTTGTVASSTVSINSVTGAVTFGAEVVLPGAITATGDITAVAVAATEIRVYAPRGSGSGARLREWKFLNGFWTDLGDQQWSDGTDVVPTFGIGATRGFQDSSATASTYGAIPIWPDNLIEFARKDNASPFRWSKVTFTCTAGGFGCVGGTASSWAGTGGAGLPSSGTQPRAAARPGLAYQKRSGQADYVGRFYMAINQSAQCSEPFKAPDPPTGAPSDCTSRLIMTEGNLATGTPLSRRLTWITPAHQLTGKLAVGGSSLVNDLTRDSNLRIAFTEPDGSGTFEPLGDGIFNANLGDLNDNAYVSGALRAALCMDGGTWPYGCTLPVSLP